MRTSVSVSIFFTKRSCLEKFSVLSVQSGFLCAVRTHVGKTLVCTHTHQCLPTCVRVFGGKGSGGTMEITHPLGIRQKSLFKCYFSVMVLCFGLIAD